MSELSLLRDLRVLSKKVYFISLTFPIDERFNTTSQMKRAVISVRLNVREGNVFYDKRKNTHFERALGSLHEVDECMLIANEFNWISDESFNDYRDIYWLVLNKLKKLIQSLNSNSQRSD